MNYSSVPGVDVSSIERLLAGAAAAPYSAANPAPVHMCVNCTTAVACNLIRERWLCDPCSAPALPVGISAQDTARVAQMLSDLVDAVTHLDTRVDLLDTHVREVTRRADEALARFKGGPMGLLKTRKAA